MISCNLIALNATCVLRLSNSHLQLELLWAAELCIWLPAWLFLWDVQLGFSNLTCSKLNSCYMSPPLPHTSLSCHFSPFLLMAFPSLINHLGSKPWISFLPFSLTPYADCKEILLASVSDDVWKLSSSLHSHPHHITPGPSHVSSPAWITVGTS